MLTDDEVLTLGRYALAILDVRLLPLDESAWAHGAVVAGGTRAPCGRERRRGAASGGRRRTQRATHRSGSWCSRYCRRVIQPRIIDLVIHHFSGLIAKYTCAITRPTSATPHAP